MARLIIDKTATRKITGIKRIDRITNDKYQELSKAADLRIEKNNREYAATYIRASLYTAK